MRNINKINKSLRKTAKYVVYARMYRWFSENEIDIASYLKSIDSDLWDETLAYGETLTMSATEELVRRSSTVGLPNHDIGGGAEWSLLYFLVRNRKPATMIETGVAMGWSSRAILDAMHVNGYGNLHSIDLPYADRPGREDVGVSESDVGCLVPENLRDRWSLYIGSDREHLPGIVAGIGAIDIFHYDSDKSYGGRRWAMEQIEGKMSHGSTVIMDDIKDNGLFRDYVKYTPCNWRILRQASSDRWVGMIDIE